MSTALRPAPATRRAWIAAGFILVGFVVSIVVGEGLLAMQGYDSADDVPAAAVALAGGGGILVFEVPCIVTWVLGRRAVAAGEPQGNSPAVVAAVVGVAFLALNLVGLIGGLLGF
jgi:hypothetical protein